MAKSRLSTHLGVSLALLLSFPFTALAATVDVTGLKASSGDEEVELSWDSVSGAESYNVYIGLSSVEDGDADDYTFGSTSSTKNSYTVTDLSNDITYYFAVTAIDSDGNESEAYSNEVSAKPAAGGADEDDTKAPTVKSAEALSSTQVKVEFSEDLDEVNASDFSIESEGGDTLKVKDAELSDDASVVLLSTEAQSDGEDYIVTAASSVEDLAGNPVDSGSSDTASFKGTGAAEDPDGPADEDVEIKSVKATAVNEIQVTFDSDPGELTVKDFEIQLSSDATETVEILAATQDAEDPEVYVLVTTDLESGEEYLVTVGSSSKKFDAKITASDPDLNLAPDDPEKFAGQAVGQDGVTLTWTAPSDSQVSVDHYMLYQKMSDGSYGEGAEISKSKTDYNIGGLTAGEYTFKLSSVSAKGEESEGVTVTINLVENLPESGPGLLVFAGIAAAASGLMIRRKISA